MDKEIAASNATEEDVFELLRALSVVGKEMKVSAYPSCPIDRFIWVGDEYRPENMNAAKLFIENGLKNQGVILGRNGFKVHDVHSESSLFNVNLTSIRVRASTDILVAPYKAARVFGCSSCVGTAQCCCRSY